MSLKPKNIYFHTVVQKNPPLYNFVNIVPISRTERVCNIFLTISTTDEEIGP